MVMLMWKKKVVWSVFVGVLFRLVFGILFGLFVKVKVEVIGV